VTALSFTVKLVVSLLVLATPLLGVWAASSLAAFGGRATWLPIVAGLLAFPLAPLGWDAWSEHRREQKKDTRERILTFGDRLLLRTFVINFVLLALLLATRPAVAFTALSTRGDWMLDGRHGAWAEQARRVLFGVAAKLEWLHELSHENRFAKLVEDDSDVKPDPAPAPAVTPTATSTATSTPGPAPAPTSETKPGPRPERKPETWPLPAELHPLVRDFPAAEEGSFESVARVIKAREPEPRARLKALHDYVADRIAYDAEALADRAIPPQGAASVFAAKKGVCAGYANLLQAMAKVTGDEVVVVVGDARTDVDTIGGGGHAWNAAKLGGQWYLLDPTWDSGHVKGRTFTKRYTTDYFLSPPEVFGVDHLPEEEHWQLRRRPISRGEFMRQPMLRARFHRHGFGLEKPDRSQVTVGAELGIELTNPAGAFVLANLTPKGAPDDELGERCDVRPGPRIGVSCRFPRDGVYRVLLFAGPQEYGNFEHVGTFEAVSRR
jgi:hypothetical protein